MNPSFTRDELQEHIFRIFEKEFEIENPELDVNLRDNYDFDSIDAIDLLVEIEKLLKTQLTQEEKKQAMSIRTINQILDYIEKMAAARAT